jgi:hypothetical protein
VRLADGGLVVELGFFPSAERKQIELTVVSWKAGLLTTRAYVQTPRDEVELGNNHADPPATVMVEGELLSATLGLQVGAEGQAALVLMGEPGERYEIEVSDNLTGWRRLSEAVAGSDGVVIPLEGVALNRAMFYRAVPAMALLP